METADDWVDVEHATCGFLYVTSVKSRKQETTIMFLYHLP